MYKCPFEGEGNVRIGFNEVDLRAVIEMEPCVHPVDLTGMSLLSHMGNHCPGALNSWGTTVQLKLF